MRTSIESIEPLPRSGPFPTQDPFLFCVHHADQYPVANGALGPNDTLTGRQLGSDFSNRDGWNMYHGRTIPGFPRHPHRGFETVTVVKSGLIDHADSLGAGARYGNGDVQWLTAGNGINHAEMFPLLNTEGENPIDFFQIWLNLPRHAKRVAPHFSMFWANDVPKIKLTSAKGVVGSADVIAGALLGASPPKPPPNSWANASQNKVGIARIELNEGVHWTLPAGAAGLNRSLYVVNGNIAVHGHAALSRAYLKLKSDVPLAIQTLAEPVVLLLLEGRPIGEPVAQYGPFVMNTRAEIAEAFDDYKRTNFGGWPWTSPDPVHGKSRKRFVRRPDGQMELPS